MIVVYSLFLNDKFILFQIDFYVYIISSSYYYHALCFWDSGIVVDQNQALRFAMDIARGMEFLHSMEPMIPNFVLTSKHVMVNVYDIFVHVFIFLIFCNLILFFW